MNVYSHIGKIAARMRRMAEHTPWDTTLDGRGICILAMCSRKDSMTGASLLFTQDFGHHTSGWWKNPDYERCFHLSIASLAMLMKNDPKTAKFADSVPELTQALREQWVRSFFQENVRLLWIEPPYTKQGKSTDTWHYRLFIDNETLVPLLPRGEVYSREFTEAGWKSWSEVHANDVSNA